MFLENVVYRYYDWLEPTLDSLFSDSSLAPPAEDFSPGTALPARTDQLRRFFDASGISHATLGTYRDRELSLLNLANNPGTRTTKTLASLLTVARAVRFIQDTGQRVMILTPSSANKATAMRDAVLRALECGLVTADQLSVTTVVPVGSREKLWESTLFTDPTLRARNPVAVYPGARPEQVKPLARHVVENYTEALRETTDIQLWYTLDIRNYMAADSMRAFAEAEFFPPSPGVPRLHVHAVSSAYGLLGHARGHATLSARGAAVGEAPHYFLVQHLGAPDMVLSLHHDSTDVAHLPSYAYDADAARYVQRTDPHFPYVTQDPGEVLDPTFYTRQPATSPRMNALIRDQGGGGIVVSRQECLNRYAEVGALLEHAGTTLPADPADLREWSLVMAVTGLLNAVDRGLVPERDVLIHASGSYSTEDFSPLPADGLHIVEDGESLRQVVEKAARS
ncbi:hypothetical protein JBE04_02465 [Streptomyces sp. PRKS01-29]|nr:DUF6002 family protein [Streptomyces sabulosicollis]MBI0293382.1 hypothetical protein [Streptomyces sabulosicollis]